MLPVTRRWPAPARCTVFAAGIPWPAEVGEDRDKEEMTVSFRESTIVDLGIAETQLSTTLSEREGRAVRVRCEGRRQRLSVPGATTACTIETDSSSQKSVLVVKDATGRVELDDPE